jgi:hypothetical protein
LVLPWSGTFDVGALRIAVSWLIERQGILDSRYVADERNELLVTTGVSHDAVVSTVDLRDVSIEDREGRARAVAHDIARRSFDLTAGPLWRIGILQLADREFAIVLVVHHSIIDGWSLRILQVELVTLYRAVAAGAAVDLKPLPLQFSEVARQQQQWLESEGALPHVTYWRQVLRVPHAQFRLPGEHVSRADCAEVGTPTSGSISKSATDRLRRMSQAQQCTLFLITVTAFAVLASEWAGTEDVLIWIGHSGRLDRKVHGLIGPFADAWPLRIDAHRDLPFTAVLKSAKTANLEALSHTRVPGARIRAELDRIRERSYPGVVFNYVRQQEGAPLGNDLKWVPLRGRFPENSRHALGVGVFEAGDRIAWAIGHASRMFRDATVARMSHLYSGILESISANPHARIFELLSSARELRTGS